MWERKDEREGGREGWFKTDCVRRELIDGIMM